MFVTLMYHLVDDDIVDPMSITVSQFEAQLSLLSSLDVALLRLSDARDAIASGRAPRRGLLVTFDDGYRNTIETVLPRLEEHDVPAVMAICSNQVRPETRATQTVHASDAFADVAEVEAWLDGGRDIAGHTCSHPKLTTLTDEAIEDEVGRDRDVLADLFGRPIDTFVYPFGSVDPRVERVVGRYYEHAFTDERGVPPASDRRLFMRRRRVRPEWALEDFRRCVEMELAACA